MKGVNLNPKDIRHLNWILEKISLFFQKKINFFELVNDLENLYRNCDKVPKFWSILFFEKWSDLESINADMHINNVANIPEDLLPLAEKSLKEISTHTKMALKEDLELEDTGKVVFAQKLGDAWFFCPYCQEASKMSSQTKMFRCSSCQEKLHNPDYKSPI